MISRLEVAAPTTFRPLLAAPVAPPTTKPAYRIRAVSVVGGFLDGNQFQFADGLNCFIGARGAGKTTAVELIRFALDLLPPRETDPNERRRIESLVEKNLGGGHVDVTVETQDGVPYIIRRTASEGPTVLTTDGQTTAIAAKACGFFRADVFSQNEVETIADRGESQLVLMDNFDPERIGEINASLAEVRTALATNAQQLLPLLSQIAAIGDELATLDGIDDKLRQFAAVPGGAADAINRAHAQKSLRDRERRAVAGAWQLLTDQGNQLGTLVSRLRQQSPPLFAGDVCHGQNGALVQQVQHTVADCAREVTQSLAAVGERIAAYLGDIDKASVQLRLAQQQQDVQFQQLVEQDKAARGQAAERSQLERRRNDLLAKQAQLAQLEQQGATLQTQRDRLLVVQSELLDERFRVRCEVARQINSHLSPAIRVSVEQFGNHERYLRMLEDWLRTARLRHLIVAQRLASRFSPIDLANTLRRRDTASLARIADLNSEQVEKVLVALGARETLLGLEEIELVDQPKIELRDGAVYKESHALSTGQKCTTILPILLLDSEHPLLVDQPEDNLDNRFIFETVVESIRQVKQHRQLIFVTHNPNIPVLGEAERIFVLDSDGQHARLANEGTVDQCKRDIVTLLEGGEDAFKARKRRYDY